MITTHKNVTVEQADYLNTIARTAHDYRRACLEMTTRCNQNVNLLTKGRVPDSISYTNTAALHTLHARLETLISMADNVIVTNYDHYNTLMQLALTPADYSDPIGTPYFFRAA